MFAHITTLSTALHKSAPAEYNIFLYLLPSTTALTSKCTRFKVGKCFPPRRLIEGINHQPKPKPMSTEHRDQRDGKPGLRTWWQHITTIQKPSSAASTENAHAPSKVQALAQEYVPPPPGAVFGRSLKESLRYASVQISTADASGRLYVWGNIPAVVAKWCVHDLFISLVSLSPFVHHSISTKKRYSCTLGMGGCGLYSGLFLKENGE